jgi:hypothetical protein
MTIYNEFPKSVIEKLGYYVYFLIDPRNNEIFYVGKGVGNRVFQHINSAIKSPQESDKLNRIRSIQTKGMQVRHIIHRHGLTENEALEVEASLIDYIGIRGLTNVVNGQDSNFRGSMSAVEIIAQYKAPKIKIKEPSILIVVNQLFERGMTADDLYEITRGNWVVGLRRENAKFAFSIFHGVVREVYEIKRWFPIAARRQEQKTRQRWRFDGAISQELQHYVGGSVENYVVYGAQNPIKYVNC